LRKTPLPGNITVAIPSEIIGISSQSQVRQQPIRLSILGSEIFSIGSLLMIRKTALSMIVAAGLLGGIQGATAQTTTTVTNAYPWCVNYVQVGTNPAGTTVASLYWNEMQMVKKLSGATILWMLVGSPDYEFRADSVVITGANAPGSGAQFPLRQLTADRFALDDLNTNDLSYTYEVRAYRKGSPAGTPPVVVSGSVVKNAFN
jgi:hypothetical protein